MIVDALIGVVSITVVYLMSFLPVTSGLSGNIASGVNYIFNAAAPWQYYFPIGTASVVFVLFIGFEFALWTWIAIRSVYSFFRGSKV